MVVPVLAVVVGFAPPPAHAVNPREISATPKEKKFERDIDVIFASLFILMNSIK
jgi:hypothetical protein